MIVYGHFLDAETFPALGIGGTFWNPDNNGSALFEPFLKHCQAHPDFRYVLGFWFTEDRLRNAGGLWERDARNALGALQEHGILEQCAALSYDDEWWTALWGERFTSTAEAMYWPSLRRLTQAQRWDQRFTIAEYFAWRTSELRTIWRNLTGTTPPPVGMSETGAVAPPEFRGQDWWGLDIYLAPHLPDQYPSATAVQRKYAEAWMFSKLAIMPVIPLFADSPDPRVPTLDALGAAYLPIIYHPRTFAVALFPFTPNHSLGEIGPGYQEGVRWLSRALATAA